MMRLIRKGERIHPLDVTRERRQRSYKALEAVDNQEAVVEEIRTSDLNTADEDFCGVGLIIGGGGNCDAAAGVHSLDFGAESEFFEVFMREQAWNDVFTEETSDGAGSSTTSSNGGIVGSKESGRTVPGGEGGVRESRNRHRQFLKAEIRQNRLQQIGDVVGHKL